MEMPIVSSGLGWMRVPGLRLFFAACIFYQTQNLAGAATLSDPAVDGYNVRVGTETFNAMYKFTPDTALVETAQAITNMGSDTIKLYLASNTSGQEGVTLAANVTNLITLARDCPSYHQVFDMPFRHFIMWAYPFANSDEWWGSGYNATAGAKDYREMYDVTRYFLTNYNNSGKTFYLGHWEGDGYLKVNGWTTNPSAATISGMIGWLNNRQKAVDDAKAATVYTNVNVFNYAECNRVRDAMNNGANNNKRVINYVIPYVTNLDYLSYSSYDAQNLSTSDLYATLNYMQAALPANKAGVVPGERIWIGEYGWGSQSTAAQEPLIRSYIQRLLGWNSGGQTLPFILYWEMYSNFNAGGGTNYCLIDYLDRKVPAWYLNNYFFNSSRLLVARFKETNGRLPTDVEFTSLVSSLLNQPLTAPVPLTVNNLGGVMLSNMNMNVSGTLAQGVYGDNEAGVWVFYGRQDGGTTAGAWETNRFVATNTNFNPAMFTATLSNLVSNTNYFFRFYATNAGGAVWAPASAQFSTLAINPSDYGSRMKLAFAGYNRGETLQNFPALVNLGTNLPGFSYHQFASPKGGDLRFSDSGGLAVIPHEIDEWNTNGTSIIWVNVPSLSSSNDFIWAYWGNPAATNPPAYTTNGAVWAADDVVWHLKETGFPYADSTEQHPALSGTAPVSTTGDIGRGCLFNGSSQFLNAGTVNVGTTFTVSAWVKLDPAANDIQTVWANSPSGYSTAAGFRLYVNSYQTQDGAVVLEACNGTTGSEIKAAAGAVSFGQWHLVSAVIDHNAGTAKLCVDGVVKASGPIRNDFPTNNGVNLAEMTDGTYKFKGSMDEARIEAGLDSTNWLWAGWATVASNATFEDYSAVTQQAPALSISNGGSGALLSWPGSGVGFMLYTATNLVPPIAWTPATNQPVLVGNQWQITLPAGNQTCFCSLVSQ
ncbi:MAG TPA: DUF2341 domain-containing protein [Candidatus Acidoferrales bacterium]|nr:DUF2341 domain-containing protein [Candidatus Acidoferrales bacterium]